MNAKDEPRIKVVIAVKGHHVFAHIRVTVGAVAKQDEIKPFGRILRFIIHDMILIAYLHHIKNDELIKDRKIGHEIHGDSIVKLICNFLTVQKRDGLHF